jgi:hypothetical protein
MTVPHVVTQAWKHTKLHSPEILTALSVSGVITTSYLSGKASFEACRIIDSNEAAEGIASDRKQRIKERVQHTWQLYIPAAVAGAVTIGCVVSSSKASGSRTAAAVTAYSLTERAFGEYKEKVVEQFGAGKEQKIRDEIVQDRVAASPSTKQVVVLGTGHILCCEMLTGRYFRSDMETLRKAENTINGKIVRERYVMLEELYDLLGLTHTTGSDHIGWDSDKHMELQFSSVLNADGEPCLAFDYNYTKPI